jgi:hypothetical protein
MYSSTCRPSASKLRTVWLSTSLSYSVLAGAGTVVLRIFLALRQAQACTAASASVMQTMHQFIRPGPGLRLTNTNINSYF